MLPLRELSRGELESVRLESRGENFDSVRESRALPSPKNGISSAVAGLNANREGACDAEIFGGGTPADDS